MMLGIMVGMTREGQFAVTQWPPWCRQFAVAGSRLVMLVLMHLRCVPSACRHAGMPGVTGGIAAVSRSSSTSAVVCPLLVFMVMMQVLWSLRFWQAHDLQHHGQAGGTGQEVAALVVDLGSFMFKACFAGNDAFLCSL